MSVQLRSRPAISGMPSVPRNPGDMNLNRRIGGISPSAYVRSSAKTGSKLPFPSIEMVEQRPTEETPGMASILQNFLLHVDHPLGVLHFRLRDGKAERLDFGRRSESGLDVSQSP